MTWIDRAREAIKTSSKESSIYIGADSVRYEKTKGKWVARYATVIIIHRDSRHGGNVFYSLVTLPDYGGLRNRLLTEVQHSLDAFSMIEDILGDRHLEIHLDVNPDPKHDSNIVAKEAQGWVRGMGLTPKIKHESWAASTAADYAARGRFTHE